MTTTPFHDLKSEDILSAHISGLQHAINKIENILGENTTQVNGHALVAVTDQADTSLHYMIYEGTVRNWLENPAPVIKRNGTIVNASEYKIEPAYGVIVFYAQQSPSDAITADIYYVSATTSVIDSIQSSIQTNASAIQSNASAIQTNATNVSKNAASLLSLMFPFCSIVGNYYTHSMTAGTFQTAVGCGNNNLDAYPIIVPATATFDKMRVNINTLAGTKFVMALYQDNGSMFPGNLLAQTAELDVSTATGTTGVHELTFTAGPQTLQPGIYWLAKWNDGALIVNDGVLNANAITLGDTLDTTKINLPDSNIPSNGAAIGGVRWTQTYSSTLPTTFPSFTGGTRYLKRAYYPSPWIHRSA